MSQKRRLNKAVIWIIICVLSFLVGYSFYFSPSFYHNYDRMELIEEDDIKYNQIENNSNQFNILGVDPWILFSDLNSFVYDIKIDYNLILGNISNLKIYTDTGNGFSEKESYPIGNKNRIIINSASEIKNLRIDFENPSQNAEVLINSISVNSPNQKNDLIKSFIFMLFSLTTTIYIFLKTLYSKVQNSLTFISNIIFIVFSFISSKIISSILYTSIGMFLIYISALIYIILLLFLSYLLRAFIEEREYAN